MGRPTKLSVAIPIMRKWFENQEQPHFNIKELRSIFINMKQEWDLAYHTKSKEWLQALMENGILKEQSVDFPNKSYRLYAKIDSSVYEKVSHLSPSSYISHYTAMFLHGLTEQVPRDIYINFPQKKHGGRVYLNQEQIQESYLKPFKRSQKIAVFEDMWLIALNGKDSDIKPCYLMEHDYFGRIRIASLEKTMIDIAVRPEYSGGVDEVLKAYKSAAGDVSISRLRALLESHSFAYPYHQPIGWYMSKSGLYKDSSIRLIKSMGTGLRFFLRKGQDLEDSYLDEEWNLFVPKGI